MSVEFPLPLPFLRAKEAARFIGVSCRTLEKHRINGTGPKYSKIGGRIIYAVTDLGEWAEHGARCATSDRGRTTIPPAKSVDKVNQIGPVPDGATSVERDAAGQPARLGTPAAALLVGVSPRTLESTASMALARTTARSVVWSFMRSATSQSGPNAVPSIRRPIQATQPCRAQYQPTGVPLS
jgi:hypothetical protein